MSVLYIKFLGGLQVRGSAETVYETTHLQDVHNKVEKEQKARGKDKPIQ